MVETLCLIGTTLAGVDLVVDDDLRVVDVAGELGLVLVLLVLGLKDLDRLTIVLVSDQAELLDVVLEHQPEVVVVGEQFVHVESRGRIERLLVPNAVGRAEAFIQRLDYPFALLQGSN